MPENLTLEVVARIDGKVWVVQHEPGLMTMHRPMDEPVWDAMRLHPGMFGWIIIDNTTEEV